MLPAQCADALGRQRSGSSYPKGLIDLGGLVGVGGVSAGSLLQLARSAGYPLSSSEHSGGPQSRQLGNWICDAVGLVEAG